MSTTNSQSPKPASIDDFYLAEVVAVSIIQGFTVRVTFSDGATRTVDVEPYLQGPVFEPLHNEPKRFRAIRVQDSTIGWENGADIDPDTLYYDGKLPWAGIEVTNKRPRLKQIKRA